MNNNYMNPVIPRGFEHVSGTWDDAFLIQDKEGNSFTWLPVGALEPNGTLDGVHFNSKLGRRNFNGDIFGKDGCWEKYDTNLRNISLMIEKYGGVYVGKYHMSADGDGVVQVVPKAIPVTYMMYRPAEEIAKALSNEDVTSCLMSGAVYDSILEWIIESGAKTLDEVTKDSTSWGNYWNSKEIFHRGLPTATRREFVVRGFADLAGNVWEWTSENLYIFQTIRGGSFFERGSVDPASRRSFYTKVNGSCYIAVRPVLYLESK